MRRLITALLLVLSGCSPAPAPIPAPERAVSARAVEPGTRPLRLVIRGDLSSFDPHRHLAIVAYSVLGNLYQPLVGWDAESRVVPALAERWEQEDQRRFTLHLRSGVRFHHGALLTVEDVLFSLRRARDLDGSKVSVFLRSVEAIRAGSEPGSVVIELERADPFFLDSLAHVSIVPRGSPDEIDRPTGTGPYRFVAYEPGKRILLRRFFAGHLPALPQEQLEPELEFLIESDAAAAVALLERGEVDLVYGLPASLAARVEADPELWVESRLGGGTVFLDLNHGAAPFDDPRVRRAVDLALDREGLSRGVTLNHSRPAGQMLLPGIVGHDPELAPTRRDVNAARRLLVEAGHGDGVEFRLETTRANAVAGAAIAEQLGEAGFRVEVVTRPWPELYADLNAGRPAAWLGTWIFDSADGAVFFGSAFHSRSADGRWGSLYLRPDQTPRDEALEAEIRAAFDEADLERRTEVLQDLNRRTTALHTRIPLYWPLDLYGIRRQLEWKARKDSALWAVEMYRKPG